jgi:hypothetical protein
MTLIGAFPLSAGVVLFADRQETISDYAKWDVSKISIYELQDVFRIFCCGAGPANTCDMVREEVWEKLRRNKSTDPKQLKELIINTVATLTKKRIIPFPRNDRPYVDMIWVIQHMEPSLIGSNPFVRIQTFRTEGLDVNTISRPYFSGNPVLLTKFLSDMYLEGTIFGMDEAEALAAYFLWEAKEYDPTCGKHSDIFLIRHDGSISRQSREDVRYWEEHFEHLKESVRFLPLLSCSTEVMRQVFDRKDRLDRLRTTVETLSSEQTKWRKKVGKRRSALEEKLMKNLRKVAMKHQARQKAALMQSASGRSKQGQ